MCYAIPGKVVGIDGKIITVDYFGEKKKARNEFYQLCAGDYIYAQGGFVIEKVPEAQALETLKAWQELFVKLKEVDEKIASQSKNLYQSANVIRHKHLGNASCVHGIIEFSNYCCNDCLYCGIRKSNDKLKRYRMSCEEILKAADYAVNKLGFKALVLQSGEDPWFTQEKLVKLVTDLRARCATLVILSIGEADIETYKKLYDAGARAVLLRFETSNEELYKKYRPGHDLKKRVELIRQLGKLGYLIMTGFQIGLPGQTEQDILNDIDLAVSLGVEMFSFGPFIAHPDTPLRRGGLYGRPKKADLLELTLNTIARVRIKCPDSKILVTTALETLDKKNGARDGLLAGANSIMIDVTPEKYRKLYEIYPARAGMTISLEERIKNVITLLHSIGRAPVDLGV